jgi:hypothetical protein
MARNAVAALGEVMMEVTAAERTKSAGRLTRGVGKFEFVWGRCSVSKLLGSSS